VSLLLSTKCRVLHFFYIHGLGAIIANFSYAVVENAAVREWNQAGPLNRRVKNYAKK
jgi:hypothetical protein